MRFRIYYAIFDAGDGEYHRWTYEGQGFDDACKAPTEGVQVIVQENPNQQKSAIPGCDIISQFDWYCWRADQGWIGMNSGGYETYLREKGFPKYIIHGYNMRNDAFNKCLTQALKEGLGE